MTDTASPPPAAASAPPQSAPTPAPDLDLDVADPLVELSRAFKAAMVAVRRLRGRETQRDAGGLSYAQYSLLFGLAECAELSSRELADAAYLSPATVTQMLDSLEAHGLVLRTRSARDKRVVLTGLTERGQQLVDERRAQWEPRWRATLGEFDRDELQAATAVLGRLASLFDEMAQE
jgi:DNA-binding MarR family transcriptional regulator